MVRVENFETEPMPSWKARTTGKVPELAKAAVPLKLATYLGVVTSIAAFLYAAYFMVRTLIFGNPIPGYPSLIVIMLFLGGVQLICLGIIGEYLGRTYGESKGRALYFLKGYHPADPGVVDAAEAVDTLSDK